MLPFNRAFCALLITQFFGAFNDNLFKSALLILVAFQPENFGVAAIDGGILGAIAAGLFILPFFLFSATAGELADTRDKARMSRIVKTSEILLMLIAAIGFFQESLLVLLLALFGTGVQSAFFGPIKYAVILQYVPGSALVSANGWIESSTFLAVLLGTIIGGTLAVTGEHSATYCAIAVVSVALAGRFSAAFMPAAPSVRTEKALLNPLSATPSVLRRAIAQRKAWIAIPFISWFWFVGATYLAQMPFYVRDVACGDSSAVTLFLAAFSVGIAIGSLLCETLTRGAASLKAAPFAALVMGFGAIGLHLSSITMTQAHPETLLSFEMFFLDPHRFLMLFSFTVIAASGGVYIVPLYAMMQHESQNDCRSVIIAANNIINALAMAVSAVTAAALTATGVGIDMLFFGVGCGNFFITLIIMRHIRKSG